MGISMNHLVPEHSQMITYASHLLLQANTVFTVDRTSAVKTETDDIETDWRNNEQI